MKTFRELDFCNIPARSLMRCISKGIDAGDGMPFSGLVKTYETYAGSNEESKHGEKGQKADRGMVGEGAVASRKNLDNKRINARDFAEGQFTRDVYTLAQMTAIEQGANQKRLMCHDLEGMVGVGS